MGNHREGLILALALVGVFHSAVGGVNEASGSLSKSSEENYSVSNECLDGDCGQIRALPPNQIHEGLWSKAFDPNRAVIAGYDSGLSNDNKFAYICRVQSDKGPIIGKYLKANKACYIIEPNSTESWSETPGEYEILVSDGGSHSYAWTSKQDERILGGAITAGVTPSGETQFICRGRRPVYNQREFIVPGLYSPSSGKCAIAQWGPQNVLSDYEILVNLYSLCDEQAPTEDKWIKTAKLISNAVRAGSEFEKQSGGRKYFSSYVCRAEDGSRMIPGKFWAPSQDCWYAAGDKEDHKQGELLVSTPEKAYAWSPQINESSVTGAVDAGADTGYPGIICRAMIEKGDARSYRSTSLQLPGRLLPHEGVCAVALNGVQKQPNYEILVDLHHTCGPTPTTTTTHVPPTESTTREPTTESTTPEPTTTTTTPEPTTESTTESTTPEPTTTTTTSEPTTESTTESTTPEPTTTTTTPEPTTESTTESTTPEPTTTTTTPEPTTESTTESTTPEPTTTSTTPEPTTTTTTPETTTTSTTPEPTTTSTTSGPITVPPKTDVTPVSEILIGIVPGIKLVLDTTVGGLVRCSEDEIHGGCTGWTA